MSRVYKQPRPESNKKAAPVTETKDTGSAGKGKKNTEKVEEGGEEPPPFPSPRRGRTY